MPAPAGHPADHGAAGGRRGADRVPGAPPHAPALLPAGRGAAAAGPEQRLGPAAVHGGAGHRGVPQPQRPRRRLLRPPRRLRHVQVPAGDAGVQAARGVPGPRRRRRLVARAGRPRRPLRALPRRRARQGPRRGVPRPAAQDRREGPLEGRQLGVGPLPHVRHLPGLLHQLRRRLRLPRRCRRARAQVPDHHVLPRRGLDSSEREVDHRRDRPTSTCSAPAAPPR
uniref:Uncharacterized protein n=1 Tax=Zea mays TaxID=4577 RepID=C4JBZ3_MAIZE|nr:unknown [Zea mays]